MSIIPNESIAPVIVSKELAVSDAAADSGERLRLMRDAVVNASGLLVPSLIGLVMVPLMLHRLGAASYGLWIAIAAAAAIAGSFDLGLGWTVVRQIAADSASNPKEQTVSFFQAAASGYLLLGAVGGAAVWAGGHLLREHMQLSGALYQLAPTLFALAGLGLVGDRMASFAVAVLHGMRRFGSAVLLLSALAVVRATGIALLLWAGFGVLGIAVWHMTAALASGTTAVLLLEHFQPRFRMSAQTPVWRSLRMHVGFGLASQFTSFATSITWQTGALVVGAVAGASAIVPLHIGQRFPMFASGVGWRAAEVAFPAAGRQQGVNGDPGQEILSVTTRWTLLTVLPMCLILAVLAPYLLEIWLGRPQQGAVAVLRLTAAAVVADTLGVGAVHILWGSGRARLVLAILATVAGLTAALTWILVPYIGVVGAALALAIALLGGAIASLEIASRVCDTSALKMVVHAFRGLLLPAIVAGVISWALSLWIAPADWLALAGIVTLSGTVYGTAVYLTGARKEERWLVRGLVEALVSLGQGTWFNARLAGRSARQLLRHLREIVADRPATALAYFEKLYTAQPDPWSYCTRPRVGDERFQVATRMLDRARNGGRFARALEIGCSEGLYTAMLAERCDSLLAVDLSPTALGRARERCHDLPHVRFECWDVRVGVASTGFDLVVAMCTLEYLVRPWDLHRARQGLVDAVIPGGFLLLGTTRTEPQLEHSRWRQWLHRGRWMNDFVGRHPRLRLVETVVDDIAVHSLFQKVV